MTPERRPLSNRRRYRTRRRHLDRDGVFCTFDGFTGAAERHGATETNVLLRTSPTTGYISLAGARPRLHPAPAAAHQGTELMPKPTALACTLAVCGAAVAVGLSAAPASAASADLEYTCEWGVSDGDGGGPTGEGDAASASWDSGIEDGLIVPVGTSVPLDPYSGTITLPAEFVDALRAQDRTELTGGGVHFTVIEESDEPFFVEFSFETTPIPADGPMVVEVEGIDEDEINATEPGTYTLLAQDFFLFSGDDNDETGMGCEMTDEGDPTIDAFEAVGEEPTEEPTETVAPTVTVTATPVRPALVQTDVAEGTPAGNAGGLALAGGAAAMLALAGRLAVRRAPRRH